MKKTPLLGLFFGIFCLLGCGKKNDAQPDAPSTAAAGTIVYESAFDLHEYSLSAKSDRKLGPGTDPVRLANGSTLYVNAYTGSSYGGRRLELINEAGNQITTVVDALSYNALEGPKVSPDGSKIAFTYTDIFRKAGVPFEKGTVVIDFQANYVAGVEGYFSPDWLPDGRLVLAGDRDLGMLSGAPSTPSANAGLYIGTLANQAITVRPIATVPRNPTPISPAVSPDGRRVAFIQNAHAWVVNLDGTDLHQLTAAQNSTEGAMAWSPDGKFVAVRCFKTFETTYYSAFAVVPSTGSGPVALENGANVWLRTATGDRVGGGWGNFSWR